MAEQPQGVVTLLFTDIEGSTRLLERLGGEHFAEALLLHRQLLRDCFERHGGYEVDYEGDAFFVAFPEAGEAVAAAGEAQQALAAAEWREGQPIRVRMGLHTGEPLAVPPKYVGMDVHKAARIMSAGHGGQVLLSDATRRMVPLAKAKLLGEHRLKDLLRPEPLFQLLVDGLPDRFPALKTLGNRPTNLPVQPTPLVGRRRELRELQTKVRGGARLLTLTGAGGSGKTRVALQAAAELLEEVENGAYFVALAGVRDVGGVLPAIANALAIEEEGGEILLETLASYLEPRRLLLVLDNFEQVVDAAGDVAALIDRCPRLITLVTSRERLHVASEQVYPIPPLDVPHQGVTEAAEILEADSVALFMARAAASGGAVDSERDAYTVAEICRRLDGLPLAIELAAARTAALPPAALLRRLDQTLQLLSSGPRDADARQRTLRATIEWSHELLTRDERQLFRRLAVFPGGCRLDTAEAMWPSPAAFPILEELVGKSLIRLRRDADDEPRYGQLETIREYAREALVDASEAEREQMRAAEHLSELAGKGADGLQGPQQDLWRSRMTDEYENFRSALDSLVTAQKASQAIQLGASMADYALEVGAVAEAQRLLDELLPVAEALPDTARAPLMQWAPFVALFAGNWTHARSLAQQALAVCEAAGDDRGVGRVLNALAGVSEYEEATRLLERSLPLFAAVGDDWGLARGHLNLGVTHAAAGEAGPARRSLEQALTISERRSDIATWRGASGVLGEIAIAEGDFQEAQRRLMDALPLDAVGDAMNTAAVYIAGAEVAGSNGRPADALTLLSATARLADERGFMLDPNQSERFDAAHTAARQALDSRAAARAWRRGSTLDTARARLLIRGERRPAG